MGQCLGVKEECLTRKGFDLEKRSSRGEYILKSERVSYYMRSPQFTHTDKGTAMFHLIRHHGRKMIASKRKGSLAKGKEM